MVLKEQFAIEPRSFLDDCPTLPELSDRVEALEAELKSLSVLIKDTLARGQKKA